MSKNFWNEFRSGFMRNFSNFVIERYIIVDDETLTENEKDVFVSEINESLWKAIQETNILAIGRILPFVLVRRVIEINNELRIIVNDIDSTQRYEDYESEYKEKIKVEKLSHLINFKTISPRRQIQVSDHLIPGNAKMIISHADQISAAVDIFLDVAMFNSIGFLKQLDIEEKRAFSTMKFNFAKMNDLKSYYDCSHQYPPAYWSFAFSARIDNKQIDYYKYVQLWNMFISSNYDSKKDITPLIPPHKQMEFHRQTENLPDEYFTEKYWSNYDAGDYLVIRINRELNDNDQKLIVANLFGIPKFGVGAVKVIPITYYQIPYIYNLMNELYISAFKIVI